MVDRVAMGRRQHDGHLRMAAMVETIAMLEKETTGMEVLRTIANGHG